MIKLSKIKQKHAATKTPKLFMHKLIFILASLCSLGITSELSIR